MFYPPVGGTDAGTLQVDRPRYTLPRAAAKDLARAFFQACRTGDATVLGAMLAEGASLQVDGGGKVTSYANIISGAEALIRPIQAWARKFGQQMDLLELAVIGGLPRLGSRIDGDLQTMALQTEAGRITAIYVIRNPDKLRVVEARLP